MSFVNLFLHLYVNTANEKEAITTLDETLKEVEFTGHDLVGDGYTYAKGLEEVFELYKMFKIQADRQLGFLKNIPEDSLITNIQAVPINATSLAIQVEFSENTPKAPMSKI